MPFEFNQLFRVSRTKMEKPEPVCVELGLEGKTEKTQHCDTGREIGLFSVPCHC